MSKILLMLAKAFDTKGYPDDKNPDHWRKINGSPVHLDANGHIDGGAGGKFSGKGWTSTRHPHKAASVPAVTTSDLKSAWAKVAKYQVAMKRAKNQTTHARNAAAMQQAIQSFLSLQKQAGPAAASQFKPNVKLAQTNAAKQFAAPQSPLQSLAAATAPIQQTNSLQSGGINGKVDTGRNVKAYALSKQGFDSLRSLMTQSDDFYKIYAKFLSSPVGRSSAPAVVGKWLAQELSRRNKKYPKLGRAAAKKLKPMQLMAKLEQMRMTVNGAGFEKNPTLDNKKATSLLSMALGNNALPKVLSKADFERFLKNNPGAPEIFRGVKDVVDEKSRQKTFSAQTVSDDLKYGDTTWIGGALCLYGAGIYFSDRERTASVYASGTKGAGAVLRGCIDMSKAKVIEFEDLENMSPQSFLDLDFDVEDSMSAYALAQGYNVIRKKLDDGETYYVALDRSVLVMQKEDL